MQRPRDEASLRSVDWLDDLTEDQAAAELRACCAADEWVHTMLQRRPFVSLEKLVHAGGETVLEMGDGALAEALAAHARIGERRSGSGREEVWSRTEQAAALAADDDIQKAIAEGNRAYEQRFGHVFLIRAAGRSAQDIHDALQERLGHDATAETSVVRQELSEIVRLRLTRLVTG